MGDELERFNPEKVDQVLRALNERADTPCPRCRHPNFILVDLYGSVPLATKPDQFLLGGRHLPVVVTACANCGFISMHALTILMASPTKWSGAEPRLEAQEQLK